MQIVRWVTAAAGVGAMTWLARAGREAYHAIGVRDLAPPRTARMSQSSAWADGRFRNAAPETPAQAPTRTVTDTVKGLLTDRADRYPNGDVPLVRRALGPKSSGLHVTWFGHSSALVQIGGAAILLDPVWSARCSPSQVVGPRRIHEPPLALQDLPAIDAVVISHDHYDHLDTRTIKQLADLGPQTRFVVPLGVGAHLEQWGVEPSRIDELDWHEETTVHDVQLVATPAQHFSGRTLDRDRTLWASWVIRGAGGSVFYSGDTGYADAFAQIGERYGPFDLAIVQVGAYDVTWPNVHMTPEEGVRTSIDVGAPVALPVHWGTFSLAFHPWSEPVERVLAAAQDQGVRVVIPRPGERLDLEQLPEPTPWWRALARG